MNSPVEREPKAMDIHPQREIANFLFSSFYFSQGRGALQEKMLMDGHDYYGQFLDRVDQERVINDVAVRSLSWVSRAPHKRMNNSAGQIRGEVTKQSKKLFSPDGYDRAQYWEPDGTLDPWLDGHVADGILKRDEVFLFGLVDEDEPATVEVGRPERTIRNKSAYNARFLSHAVFYGLMLQPTGTGGFDHIFQRIHPKIAQQLNGWPTFSLLDNEVFNLHMTARPEDEKVFHAHVTECTACKNLLSS